MMNTATKHASLDTFSDASSDAHALLGAWHLVSFYIETGDGERTYPYGECLQGVLIYTDTGDMSAQLMRSDRPLFESDDQLNGSAKEMEESFKGCISYFGKYEINFAEGFVTHHVEKSLFPNWEGAPQKRFYVLKGNQLHITTQPLTWGGKHKVAVLVWQRAN